MNVAGFALEPPITAPCWPSAAPALIRDLLPFTALDLRQGVSKQFASTTDPAFVGFSDADLLARLPGASGAMPLRYGGLEALFACALGLEARRLEGVVMPEALGEGCYRHLFEVDPVLSALAPWDTASDGVDAGDLTAPGQRKVRRGTLAAYREFGVWELLSCMVSQLSLAWQPDGCTCTVETMAYALSTSPTVNTAAVLRRAVPNSAPEVTLWDLEVRLAPWSPTTPLGSGDRLAVSSASLTVQNPLVSASGPRTGLASEEFERSGPPLVQGSLLVPRYTSNTLVQAWPANTRWMLALRCTGPDMRPGVPWQLHLYVPGLYLTQADPSPLSHGRSSLPVQWYAATPPAPAAGMPICSKLGPLIVEVVSDVSQHTLLGG
jgi:hypothetical protein